MTSRHYIGNQEHTQLKCYGGGTPAPPRLPHLSGLTFRPPTFLHASGIPCWLLLMNEQEIRRRTKNVAVGEGTWVWNYRHDIIQIGCPFCSQTVFPIYRVKDIADLSALRKNCSVWLLRLVQLP